MSGLPPVLDVAAVMARYGLRDRRAARRIIDEAGGFRVAGRLVVREDRLDEWERDRMEARAYTPGALATGPRPTSRRRPPPSREPLAPGWWRETGGAG